VDQRGYLNKPSDPTTGLGLLGDRQYDPATGRFLSVDPVLQSGDNRVMGGYSYAADNPVNGTDPSGTMVDMGGCIGSIQACEGILARQQQAAQQAAVALEQQAENYALNGCHSGMCEMNVVRNWSNPGYAVAQTQNYALVKMQQALVAAMPKPKPQCSGFFGCLWHSVTHVWSDVQKISRIVGNFASVISAGLGAAAGFASLISLIPGAQWMVPIAAGLTAMATVTGVVATAAYAVGGDMTDAAACAAGTAVGALTGGLGEIGGRVAGVAAKAATTGAEETASVGRTFAAGGAMGLMDRAEEALPATQKTPAGALRLAKTMITLTGTVPSVSLVSPSVPTIKTMMTDPMASG
jgi:RHS repeat-associated protein